MTPTVAPFLDGRPPDSPHPAPARLAEVERHFRARPVTTLARDSRYQVYYCRRHPGQGPSQTTTLRTLDELRTRLFASAAAVAACLGVAAGPSAVAAPDVANLPVATANPGGLPASVIAGLPPIVQKSHTKLSLESYIPGSPIVYPPDGTPVPGQSKAALAKLDSIDAASGGLARFSGNWCMTAYAIAGGGWSPPSVCPVAVWGLTRLVLPLQLGSDRARRVDGLPAGGARLDGRLRWWRHDRPTVARNRVRHSERRGRELGQCTRQPPRSDCEVERRTHGVRCQLDLTVESSGQFWRESVNMPPRLSASQLFWWGPGSDRVGNRYVGIDGQGELPCCIERVLGRCNTPLDVVHPRDRCLPSVVHRQSRHTRARRY